MKKTEKRINLDELKQFARERNRRKKALDPELAKIINQTQGGDPPTLPSVAIDAPTPREIRRKGGIFLTTRPISGPPRLPAKRKTRKQEKLIENAPSDISTKFFPPSEADF